MRAQTMVPILPAAALAPAAWADDESAAIAAAIESAYIGGIWMDGDEAAARGGFDAAFVMQVNQKEGVLSASLDGWLERLGLDGGPRKEGITHRFAVLDRTGDAAVAPVELLRGGEPLYTDYMSLYKLANGWKIVAKTFHSH